MRFLMQLNIKVIMLLLLLLFLATLITRIH